MSEKPYVRNPKGSVGGFGKFGVCEQDLEDFEQEQKILEWLKSEGRSEQFGCQYISRKGTPRNTLIVGSFSLDQQIGEDGSGTFADLIVGCDGRDLECGSEVDEPAPDPKQKIFSYLTALGFGQEDSQWLVKTLKLSIQENRSLFEKSASDSEW